MSRMKAWSVTDSKCNTGYSYIVFAETRGKAIRYALNHCDGTFDWETFTTMMAHRRPSLDKYYYGRREMDWCDMGDRVAMVREAGFECGYEADVTVEECRECPAHEWCARFERMTDDE